MMKKAGNKQKKITEIVEIDVVYKLYHVVQNVYQDFVYQMWSTFCTTVDIALIARSARSLVLSSITLLH